MYVLAQNAPQQNTYFALPPGRGLGDLSTDPLGTIAALATPTNVLLGVGALIGGAFLLNAMGSGGSKRRRRAPQPPTLLPMKTAIQLALGTLVVTGFAYEVGKKTA